MAERDELEQRLALARRALVAPAALKERVLSRLLPPHAARAEGAGARAPRAAAESAGWLALGRRWLRRGLSPGAVAVLVGLGFGAGFWLGRWPVESELTPLEPRQAPVELDPSAALAAQGLAPAAAPVAPAVPLVTPSAGEPDANAAPARPAGVSAREPSRATSSSGVQSRTRPRSGARSVRSEDEALAREIALLARVERAIRSGEPRLALALLDELDGHFPDAKLAHERAAAHVLARCLLPAARERGSAEARAAQALAERFLREQAASVYGDRIRSACALEPVHERSATSKNSALPDTQSKEVR